MTLLQKANQLYLEKKYKKAELLYEKVLSSNTHDLVLKMGIEAIISINDKIHKSNSSFSANCIATAANNKFFNSLSRLVRDAFSANDSSCLSRIYIFDLGLESWQKSFLQNISNVEVLDAELSSDINYGTYSTEDIFNVSTFFFKVAAFNEISKKAKSDFKSVNLLWLDAGNTVNDGLSTIFNIIENDEYFFIDHSDVQFIYGKLDNSLANCLSPLMFEGKNINLKTPSLEELRKPYIKANCFGIKLSSDKMSILIDQHRHICTNTDCLDVPRVISGDERLHWRKLYKLDEPWLTFKIGRHEQSVWSYLVTINNLRVRSAIPFSFTVAAGTGTIDQENWLKKVQNLIQKFDYRYKKML